MDKKDQDIQRKLSELEQAVMHEAPLHPASIEKRTDVTHNPGTSTSLAPKSNVQNDLCYFGGIGLILTGLGMLFNHMRVGTGFLNMLGMGAGGFGLLLIPLMIGIGWLMYNPKSKAPWIITSATCAVICFSLLSSLIMSFPSMTLLGMIIMLLPFAAGGALLLKGMGGPKAIEDKLKSS